MKCVICKCDVIYGRNIEGLGFVCNNCLHLKSYNTANDKTIGERKKLPRYSFELELTKQMNNAYKLLKYNFIPTYDASVAVEYKSPIYSDFYHYNHITNIINGLDKRSVASTHIHIEIIFYYHKQALANYWHTIWEPLTNFLYDNREFTKEIFGRFFNKWSKKNISVYDRYSSFNINTKYQTFEVRLTKFKNPKQFRKVIYWSRLVGYIFSNIEVNYDTKTISKFELLKTRHKIMKSFDYVFKDKLKQYNLNIMDYYKKYYSSF
jgi:hypothetical protein